MKFVWLVIDEQTGRVLAVYSEATTAEKLKPVLEEKFETKAIIEKKTVDLELNRLK